MSFHSQQQARVGREFAVAALVVIVFYGLAALGGCVVISAVVGR